MQHILYIEQAKRLSVEQDCLLITDENDQELSVHIQDVLAVVIESVWTQISTPALLLCVTNNVPVIYCNEQHQPAFYCLDIYRHSVLLERLQAQIQWTALRKQQAWLMILKQKLQHQMAVLRLTHKDPMSITKINTICQILDEPLINENQVNAAEAIAARIYFRQLFGEGFKRFEEDSINYALNYAYAIVRAVIMNGLCAKGLHPSLGIWHHSIRNLFNLSDDLIEPLRPCVDKIIAEINPRHSFSQADKKVVLSFLYSKVLFKEKPYTLKQAIKLYIDSFHQFMMGECDKIAIITMDWDA